MLEIGLSERSLPDTLPSVEEKEAAAPLALLAQSLLSPLLSDGQKILFAPGLQPRERLAQLEGVLHTDPLTFADCDPGSILLRISRLVTATNMLKTTGQMRGSDLPDATMRTVSDLYAKVIENHDSLPVESLIKCIWAMPLLTRPSVELFRSSEIRLAPILGTLSSGELSNVFEAYAAAFITCPTLWNALDGIIHAGMIPVRAKDRVRIVRSAAILRADNEILVTSLHDGIEPDSLSILDKVNLAWGLAAQDNPRTQVALQLALASAEKVNRFDRWTNVIPLILLQACKGSSTPVPAWLDSIIEAKEQRSSACSALTHGNVHLLSANNFERSVASTLSTFHHQGVVIYPHRNLGGYTVDFDVLVPLATNRGVFRPYALECDGVRYHYLNASIDDGLNGADLFREKVLGRYGRKVARINDEEWFNQSDRRQLVRQKIGLR